MLRWVDWRLSKPFLTALHCVVAIYIQCVSQHHADWLRRTVTWHHWWIFIPALRVGGMTTREVRRSLSTKFRRLTSMRSSYYSQSAAKTNQRWDLFHVGTPSAERLRQRHVDLLPVDINVRSYLLTDWHAAVNIDERMNDWQWVSNVELSGRAIVVDLVSAAQSSHSVSIQCTLAMMDVVRQHHHYLASCLHLVG